MASMTMSMLEEKKYSDYTDYPRIFEDVYWGNFKLYLNDTSTHRREELEDICVNRNKLVEEHKIKKNISNPSTKLRGKVLSELSPWKRHIEYYKCEDKKVIVIFSKYVENDNEHSKYISIGYKAIPPIYSFNQKSYMKVY